MAKNNNKEQVKENEALEVDVTQNPNVPEHSDEIRKVVEEMKVAVAKYERGWSVKHIEPMKEQIKTILEQNKENEFLSKSDKNFLYAVNRIIYAKVEVPAWRRQAQSQEEKTRPENMPEQLKFGTLNDKMATLKRALEGYGNKSIITTIEDIKENTFYCLKETEIDGKMELECSIKFEVNNGVANTSGMTPEEAYSVKQAYYEIKDKPEEIKNVSYYERTINNNPNYADRYFEKIAVNKQKEVELMNNSTLVQEMEEAEVN